MHGRRASGRGSPHRTRPAVDMATDDDTTTLRERIEACAELLEAIDDDRGTLADVDRELRERLLIAAGKVSRPEKHARIALARAHRKRRKVESRNADQALLDKTGIRQLRDNPIFLTPRRRALFDGQEVDAPQPTDDSGGQPPIGSVTEERTCYVCQKPYREVHFFYDQMCVSCGDFNHAKRSQEGDLRGRVALVTGSRVKIGYQAAILLLRSGCRVICTTRFPRDAARRYAAEDDFGDWKDRLHIHGIDLRHTPSVEALCQHLNRTLDRLDFIINNACQTVRRPPGFYDHLMEAELAAPADLPSAQRALLGTDLASGASTIEGDGAGTLAHLTDTAAERELASVPAAALSQFEFLSEDSERGDHLFPSGELDADLQQVDLRKVNSWRLRMAEVPAVELLEVHLVNAVAPFILNARLKPLMLAVPSRDKHIVNVSAMEGQFYRIFKTDRHPHTNMAKASLNMMTRTSAADYVQNGIHMNSVDTGWVTDEDPIDHATNKREMHRFHPPLDIVDGAARIVDPIFDGLRTGEHVWGQFLKDYRITDW